MSRATFLHRYLRIAARWAAVGACLSSLGASADSLSDNVAAIKALTPEIVGRKMHIKNGALDTTAIFDTSDAIHLRTGFFSIGGAHAFLRAFLDKKTGEVSFQVYEHIVYSSPSWRFYRSATYTGATGAVDATGFDSIDQDVIDCTGYGGCVYAEDFGFEVPEQTLRWIGQKYSPGANMMWLFKFVAKSGPDLEDGISAAEIKGLIDTVDGYKAQVVR
jgi:hypothetical protein